MKILFLVSTMHYGGAQRVAATLSNAWAARGDEVILMPTYSGRGENQYDLHPKVNLDFLADHFGSSRNILNRFLTLRRQIKALNPDVIIAFQTHVNVAAIMAAKGLSIPVIVSERTYPPMEKRNWKRYDLVRRAIYRFADRVVVQTQDTADWLAQDCPGATGVIIPNPVRDIEDDDDAPAAPQQKTKKQILSVGRMITSKRFDILIDAFSAIAPQFPDWELVILGDGPEYAALQERALALNIPVILPGFITDVSPYYHGADLFVMPSAYEGMPNVLMEAMAHGLPAICFDIKTGVRDLIGQNEFGVIIPDDNHVERLIDEMSSLMADQEKLRALGIAAQSVKARFSLNIILEKWDELIQQLRKH